MQAPKEYFIVRNAPERFGISTSCTTSDFEYEKVVKSCGPFRAEYNAPVCDVLKNGCGLTNRIETVKFYENDTVLFEIEVKFCRTSDPLVIFHDTKDYSKPLKERVLFFIVEGYRNFNIYDMNNKFIRKAWVPEGNYQIEYVTDIVELNDEFMLLYGSYFNHNITYIINKHKMFVGENSLVDLFDYYGNMYNEIGCRFRDFNINRDQFEEDDNPEVIIIPVKLTAKGVLCTDKKRDFIISYEDHFRYYDVYECPNRTYLV